MSLQRAMLDAQQVAYLEPLREMLFERFFDGSSTPQVTVTEQPFEGDIVLRVHDGAIDVTPAYSFNTAVLRGRRKPLGAIAEVLDTLELQWRQARFYAELCAFARPERAAGGFVFREATP